MGLGDKNLGAGFMNKGYGQASNIDEQEIIRLRAANGGRAGIEDAYNRSGNMRVAKTLAYYGGGKKYQDGGKIVQGSGSDPYEYRQDGDNIYSREKGAVNWNAAKGEARDAIISQEFPSPSKVQSLVADNAAREQLGIPIGPEGDDQAAAYGIGVEGAGSTGTTPPVAPARTGGGGGTTTSVVDPVADVPPVSITDGLTPYQLQQKKLAEEMAAQDQTIFDEQDAAVDPTTEEVVDPTWWQENQQEVLGGARNVGTGLLNIAPNIANLNAYNNMEGVRPSNLTRAVTSEAPSMEAGRQAIIAQGRNMANEANYNNAQSSTAGRAASLASTQSALSQYAGKEAQVEAQYDARNDQATNRANQMNTQILNKNLDQQTAKDMMQLRGRAQERNAIGNKTLGFLGDINNQKLDREKMDLTRQRYDVYDQMQRAQLDFFKKNGYLASGATIPNPEDTE